MPQWTLDDIPWERFEPQKLDPELLRIVKAASLVEQNGADYARYLCGVFADDAAFQERRGAGPAKRSSTAWRSAAGRSSPIRLSTSTPKLRALHRRLPRRSRCHGLGARLARRRDDGALHRRDRHQLLLHRACRGDRRAGAEGDLPAASPPTSCAITSCSSTHLRALSRARRARQLGRLRIALGPHRESEDDELAYAYHAANEPRRRLRSQARAREPMPAAPMRSIAATMSSAPWRWC